MKLIRRTFGSLLLIATLGFVAIPFATSVHYLLRDPGLRSAGASQFACQLHRSLSRKIPDYVDSRIASGKATTLGPSQITATEWPVFGAFFYLLATENLQDSWKRGELPNQAEPALTADEAIEASLRIMLDEGHAHWVRDYWGDDYLNEPNCFFRTLMIGSLTAHYNLTGNPEHLPLLRQITADLASDLDESPVGLIDDYPEQCFPADVGVAVAMVLHADSALGTDRSDWAKASFARLLDTFPDGLPPYTADDHTGTELSPSRGCTNGFFFSFARRIDPSPADESYALYASRFWQERGLARGWREFPSPAQQGSEEPLYIDPDSGPVISGFGTSATGLGLGAARLHGDHQRAGELGAELITTSLPYPGGHLLIPSLVADIEHAPHFPKIVILHQLSLSSASTSTPAPLPPIVCLVLGIELLLTLLFFRLSWLLLRSRRFPRNVKRRAKSS